MPMSARSIAGRGRRVQSDTIVESITTRHRAGADGGCPGECMQERVWHRFLTEQDRARAARQPAVRKGAGDRPVLLLVDLYRWVFGDSAEPLLDAIESWPGSCGLAGWDALPSIQRLLVEARTLGIPVVHVTGLEGMP